MPRKSLSHPDTFCYTCGEVTFKSCGRNLTHVASFILGIKWVTKKTSWVPQPCCVTYARLLTGWVNGLRQMAFAIPVA